MKTLIAALVVLFSHSVLSSWEVQYVSAGVTCAVGPSADEVISFLNQSLIDGWYECRIQRKR